MAHPLRAAAGITGIGETPVGELPGSSALSLMEDAALAALDDAGLAVADLDGLVTSRSMVAPLHRAAVILAERLGMTPELFATLEAGGATSLQMLNYALTAIGAGRARHLLCVAGDNLLTGLSRDLAVQAMAENADAEFEVPFGTFPPAAYALAARAHMHAYGTTAEQLAEVAVAARAWAALNPAAQMRQPLDLAQVLAAKRVAEPLGLNDCALVSDGGGAFVVSEPSAAAALARPPIWILGAAEAAGHEYITRAPDLTSFASALAGRRAFAMAGCRPDEVDLAQIYDCFSITPIITLEDLGFCGKGEGGAFIEGGRTGPGGDFPMNSHGGLLSHAHPGKPGGIFHLTEAVRQLRGDAGRRQVAGAELAVVTGVGGMFSAHATAILGAAR
ncbi:MAG: thiolase family protein [Alphaproteobacteria bacterium]|jgi:acetyl-CoA acetyltransferase|nr:thiolase family protein [Alphaproteobacteria bacterium]